MPAFRELPTKRSTVRRNVEIASFAAVLFASLSSEAAPGSGCPNGMEKGADTAGHCCYPGQAWAGSKCVGLPIDCPTGMSISVSNQTCEPQTCTEGRTRAADGVHCCFKGQAWSSSQQACIGRAECPKGTEASGDTCVSDDRDGDGMRNADDKCPDEAEDKNGYEDGDGCADEPKRLAGIQLAAQQEAQATQAAAQKAAAERQQVESAAAAKQAYFQAEQYKAATEWNSRASAAFNYRLWAYGLMIAGGAFGIGTGVSLGLGAANNGRIRDGGFSTGSSISYAASTGSTYNYLAIGTAIIGGALVSLGVILRIAAPAYPPERSATGLNAKRPTTGMFPLTW